MTQSGHLIDDLPLDLYKSNITVATCRARTVYPSGAPGSTLGFKEVGVARSLVVCVVFCRLLFVLWPLYRISFYLRLLTLYRISFYLPLLTLYRISFYLRLLTTPLMSTNLNIIYLNAFKFSTRIWCAILFCSAW